MSQDFSVFLCERIVLVSVVLSCSEVLFRGDLFAAIFVRTISVGPFILKIPMKGLQRF